MSVLRSVRSRPKDVNAAAWRALLWLYLPFSLSGYVIWTAYWAIAGSNLKTSYFLGEGVASPLHPKELLTGVSGIFVVLLPFLVGMAFMMWVLGRSLETRMRGDRTQTVGWVALAFIVTAIALITDFSTDI